ncbi:MAG TPA: YraN family protein [Candidatus Limnocylindria bacterium]|nr:YraN family protein [Candidatus Limnocylindria bacterium]
MDGRRRLGDQGERQAEAALAADGLRILERNARTRYGEIDLVCRGRDGYVFVEVKTRREGSFVSPEEAVGPRKVRRLSRLALSWLALHGCRDAPWSLGVVAIVAGTGPPRLRYVRVDRI